MNSQFMPLSIRRATFWMLPFDDRSVPALVDLDVMLDHLEYSWLNFQLSVYFIIKFVITFREFLFELFITEAISFPYECFYPVVLPTAKQEDSSCSVWVQVELLLYPRSESVYPFA